MSTYHWTLFQYGYNMTSENLKNFQVIKMINSTQIGWTFGYMINQTNNLDPEYRPSQLITREEFIGIIICFIVLLVISIILIILMIIIQIRQKKTTNRKI